MKELCILFGGKSTEYYVSLRSSHSVLQNADKGKYNITKVGITEDGKWFLYTGDDGKILDNSWKDDKANLKKAYFTPDTNDNYLYTADGEKRQIDVVFPVMHGANSEDGTLQGLFELKGLPFVGSGCTSSAVCMDKSYTKFILKNFGIPMAEEIVLDAEEIFTSFGSVKEKIEEKFDYPVFIKPTSAGSSIGVSKVKSGSELRKALESAAGFCRKILVEEFVKGKEIEVAVLGNYDKAFALDCGEVTPGAEFYDYDDKYINDNATFNVPAKIDDEFRADVKALAEKIYGVLCCRGLARVDFFMREDGKFLFNEINTLPGFTSISLYPRIAQSYGISYAELIDRLVLLAFE